MKLPNKKREFMAKAAEKVSVPAPVPGATVKLEKADRLTSDLLPNLPGAVKTLIFGK